MSGAGPLLPIDGERRNRPGAVAGIDVGGTKTLAVIYRDDGTGPSARPGGQSGPGAPGTGHRRWQDEHVIARVEQPTRAGSPDKLLAFLDDVVVEAAGAAGIAPFDLDAAAVGLPGMADPVTGHVRHAVNLGVGDEPTDVAGALSERIAGPVGVENDVNLAALGAAALLDLPGDVAFLSLGTGVALGLVLGGRVHRGALGAAGEIGHVPVVPDGPVCECGQRGCLETLASGRAIARAWAEVDAVRGSAKVGTGPHDGQPGALAVDDRWVPSPTTALLDAARAGDPQAMAARDTVCGQLAWAVLLVGQMVDPDTIVLGGGVAQAGDPLLVEVCRALERRAAGSPFLAALDLSSRVRIVPPDVDTGAVGAVSAARALRAGVTP